MLIAGKATDSAPSSSSRRRQDRYAPASSSGSPWPPPRQIGPTAWSTHFARRRYAALAMASTSWVVMSPLTISMRGASGRLRVVIGSACESGGAQDLAPARALAVEQDSGRVDPRRDQDRGDEHQGE